MSAELLQICLAFVDDYDITRVSLALYAELPFN